MLRCTSVLAGALAAAALVQAVSGTAEASEARGILAFHCSQVDADGSDVMGRQCGTNRRGPVSDFVLAGLGQAFRCATGWSEGSLWIQGRRCKRL